MPIPAESRPQRGRFDSLLALAVALAALAAFSLLAVDFWALTIDDTFIFLRYADNLASGYGPTWNRGGEAVEGYTSVLWVLLLSLPHLAGTNAVLFAKGLGLAAGFATLALASALAWLALRGRSPGSRLLGAALAAFVTSIFPPLALHSVTGMETPLFALLLLLLALSASSFLQAPSRGGAIGFSLVALLAALTRPEGNLAVGAAVGILLIAGERTSTKLLAPRFAVFFLLPAATYFAIRASYYEQLLPLSFYVKTGEVGVLLGTGRVRTFLGQLLLPLGAFFLIGAWALRRRLGPALAMLVVLLLFYLIPAHIMGFQWRYLVPLYPLIACVAACGAVVLVDAASVRTASRVRPEWIRVAGVGVLGLVAFALLEGLPQQRWFAEYVGRGLASAHIPLGRKLAEISPVEARSLLAISDAGAVPYYSRWRTIDTFGLNDPAIALAGRRDAAYVVGARPDVLVLLSRRAGELLSPFDWERELYEAALAAGMRKVGSLGVRNYHLWVLAWPGTEVFEALSRWRSLRP